MIVLPKHYKTQYGGIFLYLRIDMNFARLSMVVEREKLRRKILMCVNDKITHLLVDFSSRKEQEAEHFFCCLVQEMGRDFFISNSSGDDPLVMKLYDCCLKTYRIVWDKKVDKEWFLEQYSGFNVILPEQFKKDFLRC